MQTTLLGLAVAIIVALVAALVGPLFIDWGRYRSAFEAEATRLVGMPVRVAGGIDARLLPTPSLFLNGIEIGAPGREPKLRARSLGVEATLAEKPDHLVMAEPFARLRKAFGHGGWFGPERGVCVVVYRLRG